MNAAQRADFNLEGIIVNTSVGQLSQRGPPGSRGRPPPPARLPAAPGRDWERLVAVAPQVGETDFNRALEGIRANTLEIVYLKNKRLGCNEAQELAKTLKGNSSATQIDLANNDINDEGAVALAAALPTSAVRILNLANSSIGDRGVAAVAAALSASSVQKLDISYNRFGSEGLHVLVAALEQSKLTELDLSSCRIGDKEAAALAAVLINCSLMKLQLNGNIISNKGAKALGAVLADSKLVFMNLSMNDIGMDGGLALLDGVADSALTELFLYLNHCSHQLEDQINEELKKNQARTFVLQLHIGDSEATDAERQLTFRTLAGAVAASFSWSLDRAVKELPETVIAAMTSSGFQVPFKHLRAFNLRIVTPAGQLLDDDEEMSLAQQLERN